MPDHFTRPAAGERIRQLAFLLKNTAAIVGRDRSIIGPWAHSAVYAAVMVSLFYSGILAIALGAGSTATLLLLAATLMFFYKFFYYVRQDMAQVWLVAQVARGGKAQIREARARVAGMRRQAWMLGGFSLLAAYAGARARDERKGLLGWLIKLGLLALGEVWDLARHFLVPAITIDRLRLGEGATRMKALRHGVPETLVGVFGIDIAAGAAGTLMAPLWCVLVLLAAGAGLLVGDGLPAFHSGQLSELFGDDAPAWLAGRGFNWFPLLIAVWLGKVAGSLLKRAVDSFKNIYFTLFYLRLTHATEIAPERREVLEGFLRIEEPTAAVD